MYNLPYYFSEALLPFVVYMEDVHFLLDIYDQKTNSIPWFFQANAHELVISSFADREKMVTFEDESSIIMPTSSGLSITQSSLDLPYEGGQLVDLSSHKISRTTYLQQSPSSPDYLQSVFSIGGLSSFGDCLPGVDPSEIRCDAPLSYIGQGSDSLICNTETLNRAFCSNEHLQYFESDCMIQSSSNVHSAMDAFNEPCTSMAIDKAHRGRGWNVLVSVLRWRFSIKRIVAKKTRVRDIPRYCE